MIVNPTNKWAYIAVPKTGSKTISACLGQSEHPAPSMYHMGIRRASLMLPSLRDYFIFGFVRNPWARLVSLYNDFTLKRVNQYSQHVAFPRPLLSEFKYFEDLCYGLKDSEWSRNIFFAPQTKLVTYEDGRLIDFVGRFETLRQDFETVAAKIGVTVDYWPHLNEGIGDVRYQNCYNAATRDAVAEFYASDIKAFGYDF